MKNIVLIILCLISSHAISKPQLEASIYSESEVNRFRRKVHPVKLGYCLGQDTEISNDKIKNILSNNGLSGDLERRESRGDSRIREFYFGNINWNFEMDPSETLKIHFAQTTRLNQQDTSEMTCNTTITKSDVLSSSTKMTGSVLLTVPSNVFVLRIHRTQFENTESDANFKTNLTFVNRPLVGADINQNKKENVFPSSSEIPNYFFVRPGDLIRLTVEYSTDSLKDVNFSANFEVGFLGSYRCDSEQFKIGSPQLGQELMQLFSQKPKTSQQLDNIMVKSSCLQNPLFSRELLLNSHGRDLANLLGIISSSVHDNYKTSEATLQNFYQKVLSYLVLDLSKNVISDLSLFCDTTKLNTMFKIPSDFEVLTRKYHWASLSYVKIKYILNNATPLAMDSILELLQQKANKQETYASLRDPATLETLRTYIKDALSDRIINYSNIIRILEEFPQTITGRNSRLEFLNKVREVHAEAIDFRYQMQNQMRSIGSAKIDIVDLSDLPQRWAEIKRMNNNLQQDLQKNLQWFEIFDDDPTSSQFAKDLYDLNAIILKESKFLSNASLKDKEIYAALFEHHADYEPLLNLHKNEQLNARINKCLDTSHDK